MEVKAAICVFVFFIGLLIFNPFQYIPNIEKPTFYNSWDSFNWDLNYYTLMGFVAIFIVGGLILTNHLINAIWWTIYKTFKGGEFIVKRLKLSTP